MELNRDQIIKALECCASDEYICNQCPIDEKIKDDCECGKVVARNALALIKELTEEIKDLTETVEVRGKVVEKLQIAINEIEEDTRKLTEENERLRTQVEMWKSTAYCEKDRGESTKADTVRKMQKEIEARCIKGGIYPAFVKSTIDQIANELLTEDQK